jgi:hypothetical protein
MPLNPSGAISLAGPTAGQSIAVEVGQSATSQISLNDTIVRTLAQVPSGAVTMPTNFWGKSISTGTQRAIFGYGATVFLQPPGVRSSITNLVSNTGAVSGDVPGVGTARTQIAAAGYGGDKALFGFGLTSPAPSSIRTSVVNLVSNTGVVSGDTPTVATARAWLAAAGYGGDKAIFGYGNSAPSTFNITNLVSNTGVVAANSPGVGTARNQLAAAGYGGDKAIFGYGLGAPPGVRTSATNLVSNTGVVSGDTPGVGTVRSTLAASVYGGDKAIFGYGVSTPGPVYFSITNKVSNTGVVSGDTPGVGTQRSALAAAGYGGDKAIFAYGSAGSTAANMRNLINLVSNTGVVATDTPGVGTARTLLAAAGYSST